MIESKQVSITNNLFFIFGLLIIIPNIGFTLMHNFVITQYDCSKISDHILMLDCQTASNPITLTDLLIVNSIGFVLVIVGIVKYRKEIKQQSRQGVNQ